MRVLSAMSAAIHARIIAAIAAILASNPAHWRCGVLYDFGIPVTQPPLLTTNRQRLIHLHFKLHGAWIRPEECEFCGTKHCEKFDYARCGGSNGVVAVVEYYLWRLGWPINRLGRMSKAPPLPLPPCTPATPAKTKFCEKDLAAGSGKDALTRATHAEMSRDYARRCACAARGGGGSHENESGARRRTYRIARVRAVGVRHHPHCKQAGFTWGAELTKKGRAPPAGRHKVWSRAEQGDVRVGWPRDNGDRCFGVTKGERRRAAPRTKARLRVGQGSVRVGWLRDNGDVQACCTPTKTTYGSGYCPTKDGRGRAAGKHFVPTKVGSPRTKTRWHAGQGDVRAGWLCDHGDMRAWLHLDNGYIRACV
ncbi:hypothetical protein C8R44DRAFT_754961 [Mycena epipterygia]|nr:hypothetical protein C8R44DRAFT_754961 [Mycena epipterygia]